MKRTKTEIKSSSLEEKKLKSFFGLIKKTKRTILCRKTVYHTLYFTIQFAVFSPPFFFKSVKAISNKQTKRKGNECGGLRHLSATAAYFVATLVLMERRRRNCCVLQPRAVGRSTVPRRWLIRDRCAHSTGPSPANRERILDVVGVCVAHLHDRRE